VYSEHRKNEKAKGEVKKKRLSHQWRSKKKLGLS